MTKYLPVHWVIALNRTITGDGTVLKPNELESALGRPQATAFAAEAFPTLALKPAALLEALIFNHPFATGNKRTAWVTALTFLGVNGRPISAELDGPEMSDGLTNLLSEVITLMIDDKQLSLEGLAHFLEGVLTIRSPRR